VIERTGPNKGWIGEGTKNQSHNWEESSREGGTTFVQNAPVPGITGALGKEKEYDLWVSRLTSGPL